MIVNDEDAAEFWCPMTRVYNPKNKATGYNMVVEFLEDGEPDDDLQPVGNCRGSDCMMWRYAKATPLDNSGYCGLAGIPKV
jgi:hypothetical protein